MQTLRPIGNSESQEKGLPHVAQRMLDSKDVATAHRKHNRHANNAQIHALCRVVESNERRHNDALHTAATRAGENEEARAIRQGPPCFRLCGQVVHHSGGLHPAPGLPRCYSQLYRYDGETALNQRMNRNENKNCREDVMQTIQDVMSRDNPYALAFKWKKKNI